jgi:hypothetical protein
MPTLAPSLQDASLERQARLDLACAFRWAARLNLHEAIANHFSLALSADGRDFLINPYGRHFSRMRASDLLRLHTDDPDALQRRGGAQDHAPVAGVSGVCRAALFRIAGDVAGERTGFFRVRHGFT